MVAAAALLAAGSGSASDAVAAGLWHGTAEGIQVRSAQTDDHGSPAVTSNSAENYQVTLKFSFEVLSGGRISGTGNGSYDDLHWHLSGVNGSQGAFDCDVPVQGNDFPVRVGGSVSGGSGTLSLAIPDATESNDDYDCGAGYHGFATTSHYIAESLDAVGGGSISFSKSHPAIPTLRKSEDSSDSSSSLHVDNTWTIKLTPPGGSNSGGGGGGGGLPPSGNPPHRSACTIKGTSHADTLRGTRHADVICGFGGDDRIKGLGGGDKIYAGAGDDTINPGPGKDLVAAGPGADRIYAKDGRRDRIGGGPGRDRAHVDRRLDKLKSVERVG